MIWSESEVDRAMAVALEEAAFAIDHSDVPVGAALYLGTELVARRHNEREKSNDPTAHAELLALRDASRSLGGWRLDETTLVVTLEPCSMCAGALVAGRVGRLIFGTFDPKGGAVGSLYNLCSDPRLNHEVEITSGVREAECAEILRAFFAGRRI